MPLGKYIQGLFTLRADPSKYLEMKRVNARAAVQAAGFTKVEGVRASGGETYAGSGDWDQVRANLKGFGFKFFQHGSLNSVEMWTVGDITDADYHLVILFLDQQIWIQ